MKCTRPRIWLFGWILPFLFTAGTASARNRVALALHQEEQSHVTESYDLFDESPDKDPQIDKEISNAVYLKLNRQALNTLLERQSPVISLKLPFAGGSLRMIVLHKYDVRDPGFKTYERLSGGMKRAVTVDGPLCYRGIASGEDGSLAAFTFAGDEVAAVISTPDGGNYNLVLNYNQPGAGRDHYIIFRDADIRNTRLASCAVSGPDGPDIDPGAAAARGTYSNCHKLRVSMQGDYRLYQQRNSSVSSSVQYLTSLFNVISALYANEGVIAVMSEAVVNSEPDGYTYGSSGEVLYRFGEVTRNDFDGDLAQLISGYRTSSGFAPLGGLAWLNVLCQIPTRQGSVWTGPFSICNNNIMDNIPRLPIYSWDVSAASHELGHNIGSPHTQSCRWPGGPIDNCVAVEDGDCEPGPAPDPSGGTVMSYCHLTPVGINLAYGFGPLPGDLIRKNIAGRTCLRTYQPLTTIDTAFITRVANRQCTDGPWTSYYYDHNTATEADDELLLAIRTDGRDIGNVDLAGFEVSMTTQAYRSGSPRSVNAPYATGDWQEINRSWNVVSPQPAVSGSMGIRFPFTAADVSDISSAARATGLTVISFKGAAAAATPETATDADVRYYTNAASADASHWSIGNTGSYYYAEFDSDYGVFGGSMGYRSRAAGNTVELYPNPAGSWLNINAPAGLPPSASYAVAVTDNLGRLLIQQRYDAATGGNIRLDIAALSSGVYTIRYVSDGGTFKAKFVKRK